ncbi:hypothetical protein BO83DRAFT_403201 [Aspergillus eucalypticola CBS 122712]|uniref:Uncharacterized protein n=1 Tax=Aspergillus eucalypticola (strain CBS 122712 / IBT 29274) TaxID=1448314 RepID=A0A317UN30_ASPEC|nr:uncharacterized protein BO83DRAFT_403201 [Aspergillus eucalypticola CBS 122712]PWY63344.1 hypothetical protein BO83DRAFT_403201 [Aspergillus eucalypticola CBS 122712]
MHGSVTKYVHRAGLTGGAGIPVAYRRRYGGEGLGFGQERPMLLGNLDETSFPSLERSMSSGRHELARAPEQAIVAARYSRGKLSIDRASMAMIQLQAEHDIPWVTNPHAAARLQSRAQRCNLITVPPANRAAASSPYFYALLSSLSPSSSSQLSHLIPLLTRIILLRSFPSSSSSFFRRVSRRIPPIEFPNPPTISPRSPTLSRSETGPFSSPEAPSPQVTHANHHWIIRLTRILYFPSSPAPCVFSLSSRSPLNSSPSSLPIL